MRGFPEVRIGLASDTINHNQLLKIMTQSTTGCPVPPISLKTKQNKTNIPNSQKKRSDFLLPEAWGQGARGGIGARWSKGTNFQLKDKKYQGCNVQHDDYT